MLDPPVETDEAFARWLLAAVYAPDELDAGADEIARRLADGPTIVYGRIKDNLSAAASRGLVDVLRREGPNQRISASAAVGLR